MRNLIEFLVLHLVQHPEEVVVTEVEEEGIFHYDVEVHPEDRGQLIGRGGRTIEAIRTLAKVRAMKEDKVVRVNVLDDEVTSDDEDLMESADLTENVA